MPFLHITTRIEGRKHDDLLGEKSDRPSFPTFLFLDAEGEVIARHNGVRSAEAFERTWKRVLHYRELKKKDAAGDASVKADLLITECELGLARLDEVEGLEDLELTDEQKKRVRQLEVNAETEEAVLYLAGKRDKETRMAVFEDLHANYLKGVHPDTLVAYRYWDYLAEYAIERRDRPLLEECIRRLKEHGIGERGQKKLEDALAQLK